MICFSSEYPTRQTIPSLPVRGIFGTDVAISGMYHFAVLGRAALKPCGRLAKFHVVELVWNAVDRILPA